MRDRRLTPFKIDTSLIIFFRDGLVFTVDFAKMVFRIQDVMAQFVHHCVSPTVVCYVRFVE